MGCPALGLTGPVPRGISVESALLSGICKKRHRLFVLMRIRASKLTNLVLQRFSVQLRQLMPKLWYCTVELPCSEHSGHVAWLNTIHAAMLYQGTEIVQHELQMCGGDNAT